MRNASGAFLAAAVVAGLVAASPAAASPRAAVPIARASGGDLPPVIPAIVRTRVKRAERALDRLSGYVDDGDAAHAASTGKVIRRQVASAWRGAKYYIQHAPPPVADDERAGARISGGGGGAPVIADAPTATLAVFQLHDDVVSTIVELIDGAATPLLDAMSPTLSYTLDRRDAAIEYVHKIAPPVGSDDSAGVHARASGDGGGGTFDAAMPQVAVMLDDEMQQIDQLQSDAAGLPPGGTTVLRDAEVQILLTQRQVNSYWPPVPADD